MVTLFSKYACWEFLDEFKETLLNSNFSRIYFVKIAKSMWFEFELQPI